MNENKEQTKKSNTVNKSENSINKATSYNDLVKLCSENNISVECISTFKMAKLLNVTTTTIISYIDDGKLKCIKTRGGHRRIPIIEAEKFIREQYNIKNESNNEKKTEPKTEVKKVIKKVDTKQNTKTQTTVKKVINKSSKPNKKKLPVTKITKK